MLTVGRENRWVSIMQNAIYSAESHRTVRQNTRLASIDLVRGLAMALMALDHARTYFWNFTLDPLDLNRTSVAIFLTRWITHFSAPAFIFLAGVSARRMAVHLTTTELSNFLIRRGLGLVLLELTVVYFAWTFQIPGTGTPILGVIWAIGWSMVVLGALVVRTPSTLTVFGLTLIVGHHLLDGLAPEQVNGFATLWRILHVPGLTLVGKVVYPLAPWIGVMAMGYVAGRLFDLEPARRQPLLGYIGVLLIGLFLLLRFLNGYGDPTPWSGQSTPTFTVLSFLNVQKYPPSLDFLLMTLGPTLLGLAVFERGRIPWTGWLITLGRVPLFFYVLHILLAHLLAGVVALALSFDLTLLAKDPVAAGWGFPLPMAYAVWLVILIVLYPACRWFADVKARRPNGWLRYL